MNKVITRTIKDRDTLQKKAEQGKIKPASYWQGLTNTLKGLSYEDIRIIQHIELKGV